MSVINKVLRDLDKRQVAGSTVQSPADAALRSGTASVDMLAPTPLRTVRNPPRAGTRLAWAAVLLTLAGLAVGAWTTGALDGLLNMAAAPAATAQPPQAAAEQRRSTPSQAAVPAASAASGTVAVALEVRNVELAPARRFESTLALPTTRQAEPGTGAPVALAKPQKPEPPPRAPTVLPPQTATVTAPVPATVPAPALPAPALPALTPLELAQKQQQAARDALAQAQSLWNTGSRDAAVDLLQQAVASTERAATNAPAAGTTQTLVLLVRELGRMQLAEGRPGAVWDTLTRLEPTLRNEPEMWALRANAAQRLGRHQDSVHAYMTALQARPTEQRWLLGAAVSLAALGQVTSAAEMAEKARLAGPVSREIQTYLRQMGVPVKE
jgi:MSHA biogenesis protein MshN